jgi:hypothetical protein
MNNTEIVNKFLASKAFDFAAFGKFVAENGAAIASSEADGFGFVIIRPFQIHYCIPPVTRVMGGVDPAAFQAEVTGPERR